MEVVIAIAVTWGFLAGWVIRSMQQPMGPPRGSYGRPRHPGSDNSGPTTPKPPTKPQPSGGRMIPGYQPRPNHGGTPNRPPTSP